MPIDAREITAPVSLTLPGGGLDPRAVGWTRTPLHRTQGVGRSLRRFGRAKRWEYWCVISPEIVVSMTVASLDYAGLAQVWLLDRASGEQVDAVAVSPLGAGTRLPGTLGGGPATAHHRRLAITVEETVGGARLRARSRRVDADLVVPLPPGHERLGVVVPWSDRTFQYTVKDVARPVSGTVRVDGREHVVGEDAWATLDHGRGYWPRDVSWNWGFGAGVVDGHVVGLQVGGRWTDGTGSTENAVVVDGRLHKLREELTWSWTPGSATAPWRVVGESAGLVFTPWAERVDRTDLGLVSSRTQQCFGTWTGWVATEAGARQRVDGLVGSAEDVTQHW